MIGGWWWWWWIMVSYELLPKQSSPSRARREVVSAWVPGVGCRTETPATLLTTSHSLLEATEPITNRILGGRERICVCVVEWMNGSSILHYPQPTTISIYRYLYIFSIYIYTTRSSNLFASPSTRTHTHTSTTLSLSLNIVRDSRRGTYTRRWHPVPRCGGGWVQQLLLPLVTTTTTTTTSNTSTGTTTVTILLGTRLLYSSSSLQSSS